ncbi:MAG: hypothetical protein DMG14_06060 [Acidobacteria bacterium]|nr:MAG: hypothetical protein DMG14_06060 [Acidobacteriota bacterium]
MLRSSPRKRNHSPRSEARQYQGHLWSPNTGKLFYQRPDGVRAVPYTVNGDSFAALQPRLWSEKWPTIPLAPVALMPDAKRIVAIVPTSETAGSPQRHVTFLLNFSDELLRRVRP